MSEVWISSPEFSATSSPHLCSTLGQDSVKEAAIRLALARYVGGAERVNTAGKMSGARSSSIDQSEVRTRGFLANQGPGNVGYNPGVKRLLALVLADVSLLLVASSSSYKIILILSIWKWFK